MDFKISELKFIKVKKSSDQYWSIDVTILLRKEPLVEIWDMEEKEWVKNKS